MDSVERGSRRDRSAVDNEQPPLFELRGGILMRATSRLYGLAAVERAFKEEIVPTPRFLLPVAILLVLAGCQDAAAPLDEHAVADRVVSSPTSSRGIHILQQASSAPPLETYQVSFWAHVNKASAVTVNYRPVADQSQGQPFLLFYIRQNALEAGAGGAPLTSRDSLLITMTIDPVSFAVAFQPSGVLFSTKSPAFLGFCYENANPDLNGNGVVDGNDLKLEQQIAVWYQAHPWSKLSSNNDIKQLCVSTALYHFSEYAASW